ncbi:MAG TPA: aminopeptidase [Aquifex aeolicus]|nr:aminopeptidase [Aquifex aeolicus]
MFENQMQKLLKVNLNLKENERLLIFTDDYRKDLIDLVNTIEDLAKELTNYVKKVIFPTTGQHGSEPPEILWRETFGEKAVEILKEEGLLEKILSKEPYDFNKVAKILMDYHVGIPNVVLALSHYSTTHTTYRKFLTDIFKVRYASMPLFEPEMFLGPMDVDWDYVSKLSIDIAEVLTEGEYVEVESPYGVRMEFSIQGRKGIPDTGLLIGPGTYGNLPAGEAFIAPLEESAYGRLVILYAPNRKLEREISLHFKDGAVDRIEGFEDYRYELEKVFDNYPNARYIAEFGIGTNPKAKRPDNILEAEKIMGTIHIAIGDNHTFGGKNKVPFHTDYVVFEPTVVVGGKGWRKELLVKGKLQKI